MMKTTISGILLAEVKKKKPNQSIKDHWVLLKEGSLCDNVKGSDIYLIFLRFFFKLKIYLII